jgi:chaperone required for assembly of F1-ATPase
MKKPDERRRKRFYKEVAAAPTATGTFRVELDGRPIRTPGKRELALPDQSLAEAVAEEWRRQGDVIDPASMPLTRITNSALDGVAGRETEVRADIIAYAGSDLMCYFAEGPAELIERQSRLWGPIHAWAKREHGIELELTVGVMPVEQSPLMLAQFDAALVQRTSLSLAAFHVVTTLTGSALLALALLHKQLDVGEAWALAHIDEDFQIERWGTDDEAVARREQRWRDLNAAARLLHTVAPK